LVNEGIGGPAAAVACGEFPGVERQGLLRRLKGDVVNGAEDDSRSLLYRKEERELALYARACGENMMGLNRADLGDKVRDILNERRLRNRPKSGKNRETLSASAHALLDNKGGQPNKHWFERFFGFWHYETKEKSEATVDKKRVAAYTEDTVTEHFFGAAGLEDSLINNELDTRVCTKTQLELLHYSRLFLCLQKDASVH
jgi:hypothetical protein